VAAPGCENTNVERRKPPLREQVILSWSGGKDSALALVRLREDPTVEVVGLLTTLTSGYERISIHGVRRKLLERQAEALHLPVHLATLAPNSSNARYEESFASAVAVIRYAHPRVRTLAFGDISPEDVRAYREALAGRHGFGTMFPIWGEDSAALAEEVMLRGIAARLVCVDTHVLPASFAGRVYDRRLLRDLPPEVDPCGERGEFHTFVSDCAPFDRAVPYEVGATVLRDQRFAFCDLLPLDPPGEPAGRR
jgi:uncharacterized protein (TIGR00290 family)